MYSRTCNGAGDKSPRLHRRLLHCIAEAAAQPRHRPREVESDCPQRRAALLDALQLAKVLNGGQCPGAGDGWPRCKPRAAMLRHRPGGGELEHQLQRL